MIVEIYVDKPRVRQNAKLIVTTKQKKKKNKKKTGKDHKSQATSTRDSSRENDLASNRSARFIQLFRSAVPATHLEEFRSSSKESAYLSNAIRNRDYVPVSTRFVQVNRNSMKFRRIEISLSDLDKPLDIISFFFSFFFFHFSFSDYLGELAPLVYSGRFLCIFILSSVNDNQQDLDTWRNLTKLNSTGQFILVCNCFQV